MNLNDTWTLYNRFSYFFEELIKVTFSLFLLLLNKNIDSTIRILIRIGFWFPIWCINCIFGLYFSLFKPVIELVLRFFYLEFILLVPRRLKSLQIYTKFNVFLKVLFLNLKSFHISNHFGCTTGWGPLRKWLNSR